MPRRRAPIAQRGHHATGSVVLNTLSQHRLQSRRQKGSLQQFRVQLRTRCRYNEAVTAFSTWLRDGSLSPSPDKDGLDSRLCEYLEWLWHEGAHVGWADDPISGCQFFLHKKRYFSRTARSSAYRTDLFCPRCDYLLQRSAHSFRTIFATLLNALGLTSFHFTPCSLRRGEATAHWVLHRNMDSTIVECRLSSVKTAHLPEREHCSCRSQFNSLPMSTNRAKPC